MVEDGRVESHACPYPEVPGFFFLALLGKPSVGGAGKGKCMSMGMKERN